MFYRCIEDWGKICFRGEFCIQPNPTEDLSATGVGAVGGRLVAGDMVLLLEWLNQLDPNRLNQLKF